MKRSITIRIDENTYEMLEEIRVSEFPFTCSKSDFIRMLIRCEYRNFTMQNDVITINEKY